MADVRSMILAVTAKRSALVNYERYADMHREREAELQKSGWDTAASLHMEAESLLLRAWTAEEADPEPKA